MEGKAAQDAGMPVIDSGSQAHLDTLVATLSDAFEHDPILNWIFPDSGIYPDLFRLILHGSGLPRGLVQLEREGRGAALWLPPNVPFELPPGLALLKLVARCLWRMGPGPLRRLQQQAGLFARHKPAEPHFHLQFIGARQRDQGQGVGAALLKAGLRVCDGQHMPAYLECSNPRNLPLYQRHGFDTRAEAALPNGGPQVWFMWREAR